MALPRPLSTCWPTQAEKAGAQIVFNMPAVQLVQDESGAVTGAICQNADGDYVQYNAAKGVVLATGDVTCNDEYLDEFAPIAHQGEDRASAVTRATSATATTWPLGLAAAFQDGPWPTMMHPQAAGMFHGPFLFMNPEGKRFMNEATWVQGKCVGIMVNGGADHCLVDLRLQLRGRQHRVARVRRRHVLGHRSAPWAPRLPMRPASHAKTVKEGVEKTPDNYKVRRHHRGAASSSSTLTVDEAQEDHRALQRDVRDRRGHRLLQGEPTSSSPSSRAPSTLPEVGSGPAGRVLAASQISDNFEVVDAEDQPIEGLYAIGNCAGDMYAYDYPDQHSGQQPRPLPHRGQVPRRTARGRLQGAVGTQRAVGWPCGRDAAWHRDSL